MFKKIFTLMLVLTISLSAQKSFWSWEKATLVVSSTLSGYAGGWADYWEYQKDKYPTAENAAKGRTQHGWLIAERSSYVVMGATIVLSSDMKPAHLVSDILLGAVLQGFFHNGANNVARNNPWFYQSGYQKQFNTSGFEQFASPEWQISALVIALGLNYLVYEIL